MVADRAPEPLGAGSDLVGDELRIRPASPVDEMVRGLASVLVDCVEGGASVGFMRPFDQAQAMEYWAGVLDRAARGERVVLVADDGRDGVVGTVQVVLTAPENQPHRGEIAKMLVHRRARRRGVGEALMQAAEATARQAGKTLLVLDTADATADRLYERLGWKRVGVIPDYALWPDGGFVDTTVFYKHLTTDPPPSRRPPRSSS